MNEEKALHSLEVFDNALSRLEEALRLDATDINVDASIQRFEFTVELCWKTLKQFLLLEGVTATTPKSSLKLAYQAGWLAHEKVWLDMLIDWNTTSRVYKREVARKIYGRMPTYAQEMRTLHTFLSEKASVSA